MKRKSDFLSKRFCPSKNVKKKFLRDSLSLIQNICIQILNILCSKIATKDLFIKRNNSVAKKKCELLILKVNFISMPLDRCYSIVKLHSTQ